MAAELPEVVITLLVLEIHVVPKTIQGFMTTYKTFMFSRHDRRYLVSKIQDGGQLTGSSNISETMKHIIKIPTPNLWHSTVANSQV